MISIEEGRPELNDVLAPSVDRVSGQHYAKKLRFSGSETLVALANVDAAGKRTRLMIVTNEQIVVMRTSFVNWDGAVRIPIRAVEAVELADYDLLVYLRDSEEPRVFNLASAADVDFIAAKLQSGAGISTRLSAEARVVEAQARETAADDAAAAAREQSRMARRARLRHFERWLNSEKVVGRVTGTVMITLALAAVLGLYFGGRWLLGAVDGADEERCTELRAWYASAPYDSNKTIAEDFYRACDEIPPPVKNGELDMSDIR